MSRDQLERVIWWGLRDLGLERNQSAPRVVDRILTAADRYADVRDDMRVVARLTAEWSDTPEHQAARRAVLAKAGKE